jgi:hypothetical protein
VTIEQAVVERLLAVTAVAAIVGTRVYQLVLPQQVTLPAVRVQQISETTEYHVRGEINAYVTRVQVDANAAQASGTDPYAQAATLADAVHGEFVNGVAIGLSGWTGTAGGSPAEIVVTFAQRVDRRVDFEAAELRMVRVRQDYFVHWRRA